VQRREKVAERLSRSRGELDELEKKIKIQLGLSLSVRVVIGSSLKSVSYCSYGARLFLRDWPGCSSVTQQY
jgi:hypothetical protein